MNEIELQRQIDFLKNRVTELERQEYAMANTYGWISAAWQKNPLLEGYSGDKTESKSNTSAAAGANTLTSTAVPAGEIWRLQAVHAINTVSGSGQVLLYVTVNGIAVTLQQSTSLAVNIYLIWTGEVILSAGDTVNAYFAGCTLNDDIYMNYHAIRVDIDQ